MKNAITTTIIVLVLLLLIKGKIFNLHPGSEPKEKTIVTKVIENITKPTTPTPEKSEPPMVNSSQPKGWNPIMVDDGYTWYTPEDPSKTTEWFDISDWRVMDRLKAPVIMEFKTKGDGIVTFKVDGKTRHLKKKDGTFSDQQWSDEEYSSTAKRSIALRYSPISPDQPLKVRVGRRSY